MAGPPLLTPAIVVGSLRYSETSRVVRLVTRDAGAVSAIAKGALRPKSRFGAALQLLSEGQAHLIASRSTDLHTLAAFDVAATHRGLAAPLERFGAASALAELAGHFVPPLPNPELFDQFQDGIKLLELVPPEAIAVVTLRAIWQLIALLGHGPIVDRCARDGAALLAGTVPLSVRDGGFLCRGCERFGTTTRLAPDDREDFLALLTPGAELPLLTEPKIAAHRRLVLRWVRGHLGDGPLPALESWAAVGDKGTV